MNFNGKVTIQKKKKYVPNTDNTIVQSPKAEPTEIVLAQRAYIELWMHTGSLESTKDVQHIACVASVSIWFWSKERPWNGILGFGHAINETIKGQKNESGGRGKGRKEMLADKPLDFENLRSPANAAPDWLGQSNNVDMC